MFFWKLYILTQITNRKWNLEFYERIIKKKNSLFYDKLSREFWASKIEKESRQKLTVVSSYRYSRFAVWPNHVRESRSSRAIGSKASRRLETGECSRKWTVSLRWVASVPMHVRSRIVHLRSMHPRHSASRIINS